MRPGPFVLSFGTLVLTMAVLASMMAQASLRRRLSDHKDALENPDESKSSDKGDPNSRYDRGQHFNRKPGDDRSTCWTISLRLFGIHGKDYDPINGPPRYEILEHKKKGLTWMHDCMGFSCTCFGLAIFGFMFAICMNHVGPNERIGIAAFNSVLLVHTALWSFMGDYYPARVCEDPALVEFVSWWEKMMICNFIDNIVAKISLGLSLLLWSAQVSYAGRFWFYVPMLPVAAIAVICKLLGKGRYLAYDGTKNPDDIFWAFFWHSMWHLIASAIVILQTYGLVAHGFETPKLCAREAWPSEVQGELPNPSDSSDQKV